MIKDGQKENYLSRRWVAGRKKVQGLSVSRKSCDRGKMLQFPALFSLLPRKKQKMKPPGSTLFSRKW